MAGSAAEHIILAIDTSDIEKADQLARIARDAGSLYVKFGLDLSSATSWRDCSDLAARLGLGWVADAKLDDIPNTVVSAVGNLTRLQHPPMGITIHTNAGVEAMYRAQQEAGSIRMLGVTALTSLSDNDCLKLHGRPRREVVRQRSLYAVEAELAGIVASPREVAMIKDDPDTRHLYAMIPGIRPAGVDALDQSAIGTPGAAILAGADLLVIGRPITEAPDPAQAFADIAAEMQMAFDELAVSRRGI
jgi:orotidine-5'-phosphate decarboxylase